MAETTERVLRLLGLLQQRPVWTGPELAERLGVTTRSIRRDVERLRALGYPVHAAQGVGGGYQLGRGRGLPPLLLDDSEAVAVAVSLRMAAGGTVSGASEAALRTLAKLDQVMPPKLRSEVRAIHEATQTLEYGQVPVDGEALLRLARAVRDTVRVRFDYESRDKTPTYRTVEPVGLVATGRRWYLMAYDVDRCDWRTFRMDRMSSVEPTTWRFTERAHEDPAAFVQRAVASAAYRFQARIVVQAPLQEVAERTSVRSVVLSAIDDRTTLLEAGAETLYGLAFHLSLLGWEFEVQEPAELRTALAEMGGRALRAAGADTAGVGRTT
jgi:predicted DNA-binding transcriptional regulator YafY